MSNGNGARVVVEAKGGKGSRRAGRKTPRSASRSPLSSPPSEREKKKAFSGSKPEPEKRFSPPTEMDNTQAALENMLQRIGNLLVSVEGEKNAVRKIFASMDPVEREELIKRVYDRFASIENYDEHMKVTGHYGAIERLIRKEVAVHTFQFPILDITAGTGVPLCCLLSEIDKKHVLHGMSIETINGKSGPLVYVNDLSEGMIVEAEKKMVKCEDKLHDFAIKHGLDESPLFSDSHNGNIVTFKNYPFRRLHGSLKKRFGTILVAQTFHIVPYADKQKLADAINWALAPGGRVIVLEEFLWRARTNTEAKPNPVLKLIEAIATPLQKKSELISLFKDSNGLPYDMVARSVERIDRIYDDHEMTITVLQKRSPGENQRSIFI